MPFNSQSMPISSQSMPFNSQSMPTTTLPVQFIVLLYNNKYNPSMYFTQTSILDNKVIILSEYVSTRLVRKGNATSYYIARCLTHRVDPTLVGAICFIKQTLINERDINLDRYIKLYTNEVEVHQYVKSEINSPGKYYSTLYDYWHDTEGIYHRFTIVTKYEQYGDLHHFLQYVKDNKIQLTDVEVVYVLNNLLRASLELYKVGVIHRDIKPQNIFIDQNFQFKLGDFGISIVDRKNKCPWSKQKVGTYGFMAPEIFHQINYSFSVDVWAIGVVIYYMIYLVYPYGREKKGYDEKVKGRLKNIENASAYSDKFSPRLKDFMRRFFQKDPIKREPSIMLYQYEYMHEFKKKEVVARYRKHYESYIRRFNQSTLAEVERYALQQQPRYHEKVLDVVHYEQWGYFILLSNLKTIALFNSTSNTPVRMIYPDCLQEVEQPQKEDYCIIIKHVDQLHFNTFRQYLQRKGKIYTKRLDCTIDYIVQYKDTLAIRLKLDYEKTCERQLKQKEKEVLMQISRGFQHIVAKSLNPLPMDYQNNTIQVFFYPESLIENKRKYTRYEQSIIFNNNMLKKKEVLVSKISREPNTKDKYQMKKYPGVEDIDYANEPSHVNMLKHVKRIFGYAVNKEKETPGSKSAPFLEPYVVNEN